MDATGATIPSPTGRHLGLQKAQAPVFVKKTIRFFSITRAANRRVFSEEDQDV
ncbi:hypothetical protein [Algicella marina]|uniref:Uncharacterized protein n=1 Tax=Algicella marina TaxID=2683284 RepID=A0A6P1T5S7_9RHOB|nr:hypothetical protein [Algicella marina]QHQ36649.1 hypothetical protein GO499_16445 [Algicella marina]